MPLRIAVYERLRGAILDGTLKPGQVLSENRLAVQLQVSRTPIREAIRMLERESLVTMLPGRKLVVSTPTARDIDDIYGIRLIVEVAALRKIGPGDGEIIVRLEDCIARDAAALESGDAGALIEPNTDFHMVLISALDNKRLQGFIDSIHDLVNRYRLFSLEDMDWAEQAVDDHATIVRHLKAGRSEDAVSVLTRHLERANAGLKRKFKEGQGGAETA
ncbi:MAG: hypothetical protein COW30_17300 [Rhodospirillales bacterium CG15_BIG_FIL_POST_REV_8_21_14_020_66_15]|nr:MAG: hypothetical protein COW30_17300 [Rhodospirillales bacterium CG15_BIG_FIL_POST_REV_8_21_14_020_66_15]